MEFEHQNLKRWFLNQKRDLPWRKTTDPYAIWVSEIMLQQTQVATVIPYFENWMRSFPTIEKLASSDLDAVIKAWEGLGYYSRARNLHEAARYVVEHHAGSLPETEKELLKIKGIGPYTLGAIMSFAFHKKKAAVDGNVIRVLTRFFNIHEDISKPKTVKLIQGIAEAILPENEPWIVVEGLIELGATICTPKPKCLICPLKASCKGFLAGEADQLPVKSKKIKLEFLFRHAHLILAENKILVRRGRKGEIMSDLYEFPYTETTSKENLLNLNSSKFLNLHLKKIVDLEAVHHSFTRYKVYLTASIFTATKQESFLEYEWLSINELEQLSFSSGHRRLLSQFLTRTSNLFSTTPF